MIKLDNILNDLSEKLSEEVVKILASSPKVRVERIMSPASNIPSDIYDQDEGEFVMLVKGYAELEFGKTKVIMKEGDYLNIPPHSKHRVLKTYKNATWLCVFYK